MSQTNESAQQLLLQGPRQRSDQQSGALSAFAQYELLRSDIYGFDTESRFNPYQYFIKYTLTPTNQKRRYLIKHGTGLGKTLESLLIAMNWIKFNRKVHILTFNKEVFHDEIIKHGSTIGLFKPLLKSQYNNPETSHSAYIQILQQVEKHISLTGYREFENMLKRNMQPVKSGDIIICDEAHLLYNKDEKNTWGESLITIGHQFKTDITIVYMTATPLNNPDEIQDLQQLMAIDQTNYNRKIDIPRYFKNNVSFVPESTFNTPKEIFVGTILPGLPIFEVVQCEYTPQMVQLNEQIEQYDREEWRRHFTLGIESLPNFVQGYVNNNTADVQFASKAEIKVQAKDGEAILVGNFLSRDKIGNFSPKLKYLLDALLDVNSREHSFVYFNTVVGIGVTLIENMLRYNGFIDFNQSEQSTTVCFNCKRKKFEHSTNNDNKHSTSPACALFKAYKFVIFTSTDKKNAIQGLKLYNSIENAKDSTIQLIVGSRIIKQSYSVMGTQRAFILSLPYNFPNLIQVFGRVSRTGSHKYLPENQQYVKYHVLINSNPSSGATLSIDQKSYIDKYKQYELIQEYERQIHEQAIDSNLYGRVFMRFSDGKLNLKNTLKMTPYVPNNATNDPDLDEMSYYLNEVDLDLNQLIQAAIVSIFEQNVAIRIPDLMLKVRNYASLPTLKDISDGQIFLVLIQMQQFVIQEDYVFKGTTQVYSNWFLKQFENRKYTINMAQNNILGNEIDYKKVYQLLIHNCKDYVSAVQKRLIQTDNVTKSNIDPKLYETLRTEITSRMSKIKLIQALQDAFVTNNIVRMSVLLLIFQPICDTDVLGHAQEAGPKGDSRMVGFAIDSRTGIRIDGARILNVGLQENVIKYNAKVPLYGQIDFGQLKLTEIAPEINNQNITDKRKKQAGMQCLSLNQQQLENYYRLLIGKPKQFQFKKQFCAAIAEFLINIELEARMNMNYIKYVSLYDTSVN